jgi:hypothetical protein
MKAISRLLVACGLAVTFVGGIAAQDKAPASAAIPRILVIQREFVKPGKGGAAHEKTESAFVQAMAKAKWPTHYLALQALTGKPRVLFLVSYESYEAWEKDGKAIEKNTALSAALDRANEADGMLLDSTDQNVFTYNAEFSLHPLPDISNMRYLEIWVAHVRPGHYKEWSDLVKMFNSTSEKAVPTNHWGVFEAAYGQPGGTYLFLTARKSTAELDRGPMEDKAFQAALGEEGMKKLDELFGASVESSEAQLFAFSPQMSYPPDDWVKADPEFWRPKPAASTAAKAEKKPAEKKP